MEGRKGKTDSVHNIKAQDLGDGFQHVERGMARGGRDIERKTMASIHGIRHGSSFITRITEPESRPPVSSATIRRLSICRDGLERFCVLGYLVRDMGIFFFLFCFVSVGGRVERGGFSFIYCTV